MDSRRLRISIDNILILLIYLGIFLNSASAILCNQVNALGVWNTIISYSRILIVFLDLIYIIFCYLRRKIVLHGYILSVYLFLTYVIIVTILFFSPSFIHLLLNLFPWPLTFVAFYLYGERNRITPFFCKVFAFTVLVFCLLLVRTVQTRGMLGSNVGTIYYAIACLPMILTLCGRNEKIVLSIAISVITLLSAKRAGTIILLVGFSSYFICRVAQTGQLKKKIWRIIILIVLATTATLILSYYITNYNTAVMDKFNKLSDDQGSGRVIIWNKIIESFRSSSSTKQILGHGYHAVPYEINPNGNNIYAHNSFLETLYDLGIIGLAWMIIMIIYMFIIMFRLIKNKNEIGPASVFAMIIVLVLSLVSYFFDESGVIMHIACFWGLVQGLYRKNKYYIIKEALII